MASSASDAPGTTLRSTGRGRFWRSFGFAWAGIGTVLRTQPNFRVHLAATVVVLGAGIALAVPPFELALLVLTCSLVLALEALNSAVEAVCDLVSPTYHPLVKRAKDAAAAAVLLSALGAVMIGGLVLGPRLVAVLR